MNYRKYTKRRLNSRFEILRNISITNWIVVLNVIFFFIFGLIIRFDENAINYIAIKPSLILQGKYIWTFVTSMFMHVGLAHLFVNMVSLLFIGNFVERLIGRKRFLAFYLISGVVAGVFFVLFSFVFATDMKMYAVGASGAIFGLGGLLALLTPKLPVLVFFIIPMPMWLAMIFMLLVLWAISLAADIPIGNTAHLGGLAIGILYALYLKNKYKRKTEAISRFFS